MKKSLRLCLVVSLALLASLAVVGVPARAALGNAAFVRVSLSAPTVQTYDVETITVTSGRLVSVNNTTSFQASPGPIGIAVYNTNGAKLGLGCDACNLTSGIYAFSIQIDDSFGAGTITVVATDKHTGVSNASQFATVYSQAYLNNQAQKRLDAMNASAQARIDQALQGAGNAESIALAISVISPVLAFAIYSHKKARETGTKSWKDSLSDIVRMKRGMQPLSEVLNARQSFSPQTPLEVLRQQETAEIQALRQGIIDFADAAERLQVIRGDIPGLTRYIQRLRTSAGEPPEYLLETHRPLTKEELKELWTRMKETEETPEPEEIEVEPEEEMEEDAEER